MCRFVSSFRFPLPAFFARTGSKADSSFEAPETPGRDSASTTTPSRKRCRSGDEASSSSPNERAAARPRLHPRGEARPSGAAATAEVKAEATEEATEEATVEAGAAERFRGVTDDGQGENEPARNLVVNLAATEGWESAATAVSVKPEPPHTSG